MSFLPDMVQKGWTQEEVLGMKKLVRWLYVLVIVSSCVGYHVCVPTARLCAVWVENNTRHVCEQSILAGLKCPSLIYDHLINHPA